MATVQTTIDNWTSDGGERHTLYGSVPGLVIQWLNAAQLRFTHKSGCLRSTWEPTLDSEGYADLPEDFLKIVKDRVKWSSTQTLIEGNYHDLIQRTMSSTTHYCVHEGKFYVFGPSAGSPVVPYVKKPNTVTIANRTNAFLDIPSEYHEDLVLYLDAMFARRKGDVTGWIALLAAFDDKATKAGMEISRRIDPVPMMKGGLW